MSEQPVSVSTDGFEQCGGAQVITKWKRADLDDDPEVQEIQTTENCPTCDGSGQILGPST